uniref:Uncharacterized protein n=1 Tax=Rhizophora mucronata TaxID=61149 RepID=A0A2P2K7S2_RHIMU
MKMPCGTAPSALNCGLLIPISQLSLLLVSHMLE